MTAQSRAAEVHHLDYEPPTGDSWCVECQIVFATRAHAEAHTTEPVEWIDSSCGKCGPCRATCGPTPDVGGQS